MTNHDYALLTRIRERLPQGVEVRRNPSSDTFQLFRVEILREMKSPDQLAALLAELRAGASVV